MTLHGVSSGDDTESSRRVREGGSWEQPDLKDSSRSLFQVTISPFHHFTISPFHHFTISPSHHLTISPTHTTDHKQTMLKYPNTVPNKYRVKHQLFSYSMRSLDRKTAGMTRTLPPLSSINETSISIKTPPSQHKHLLHNTQPL